MRAWVIAAAVVGRRRRRPAAETVLNSPPPTPPPIQTAADVTIKEIMDTMVDPSGDVVFASVQVISDDRGVTEKGPKTDAEWSEVRHHLGVLRDASELLIVPGRKVARAGERSLDPKVENEPADTQRLIDADHTGFVRHARRLQGAADAAIKAVDAHDKDALREALTDIDKACESCHLAYFYPHDKRAQQAATEEGVPQ